MNDQLVQSFIKKLQTIKSNKKGTLECRKDIYINVQSFASYYSPK